MRGRLKDKESLNMEGRNEEKRNESKRMDAASAALEGVRVAYKGAKTENICDRKKIAGTKRSMSALVY